MDEWQTDNLVPFGRYHLGARIATGGMGEVYLAKMKGAAGFEKRVVIKKILPQLSRDPEFVKRFIDEGKLVVRLTHANIVPVLDLGEVDGDYFLAMEYVDGADLRDLLRRLAAEGRTLPLGLALFVLVELCRGLHYAHQRVDEDGRPLHIIHRDVSPANVMVSRDGAVRLVDFGIAKAADRLAHSVTGALQGKFVYMSPEQARGEPVDPRSDLFSLGSMAYELLAGLRPFEGRSDLQTLERVKRAESPPLAELRPDLPAAVVAAVHRCLARAPGDRFETVEAFQRVLQEQLFKLPEPPGERELGAFVRDLIGTRPTPVGSARARTLDELLAASLEQARGAVPGTATVTASQDVPLLRTPSPGAAPPTITPSGTQTQTALSGTNRLLIGGLVAIIAVLLYFNIRSLMVDSPGDRPAGPPTAAADVSGARAATPGPLAPPPGGPDGLAGRQAGDGAAAAPDARAAAAVATAPDAGAGDATPLPPARTLRLEGLEVGDEVLVAGAQVTPDGAGRFPLPPRGEVAVEVRRVGHVPFEHTVAADDASPSPVAADLRPARKFIRVTSVPAGALIAFDGNEAGPAPQRATVVYGRKVDVVATLAKHKPAKATLGWSDPATVKLTLEPLRMGRIRFRFLPANAVVLLNGAPLDTGASNRVDKELPAGTYRLVIRAPDGSAEKRREFTIEPGKTETLEEISLIEP